MTLLTDAIKRKMKLKMASLLANPTEEDDELGDADE